MAASRSVLQYASNSSALTGLKYARIPASDESLERLDVLPGEPTLVDEVVEGVVVVCARHPIERARARGRRQPEGEQRTRYGTARRRAREAGGADVWKAAPAPIARGRR